MIDDRAWGIGISLASSYLSQTTVEIRVGDVAGNVCVTLFHGVACQGRDRGRAAQVEPIKPTLKPPGLKLLELN